MRLLLIGRVGRAHSLRGAVQVIPFRPDSPLWRGDGELYLIDAAAVGDEPADVVEVPGATTRRVLSLRQGGKGRLLLTFEGVTDRTAADALRGTLVAVPVDELTAADEDEFYFHEVPGWEVATPSGEVVGRVVRAIEGSTDLLEVRPARGGATFYVPVVAALVLEIDRAGRRFVIDPIEGLVP